MQEQELLLVSSAEGLSDFGLRLSSIRGREELSRLYEYELAFHSDSEVELEDELLFRLLRSPVTVRFGAGGGTFLHGMLRAFEVESVGEGERVGYRATLVPRLWSLTQTQRSRVFRELDVIGILKQVLGELGWSENEQYSLELEESYPVSEYTVQYEESDFDFVSRLLEHHGIFYLFEQQDTAEKLVFADSNRAARALVEGGAVLYRPLSGGSAADGDGVTRIRRRFEARTEAVHLRDYNWRKPDAELAAREPVDTQTGSGFHVYYGEHFKDNEEGAKLAKVRSEALLADRDRYEGECRLSALAPGHSFDLDGHPLGSFNQRLLVVSIEQEIGAGEEGAPLPGKRFWAIPHRTPYRPPRRTPKPRVYGFMHAHVEAEVEGAVAPIDEDGAYLVTLPFDSGRAAREKEAGSRRIRKAEPASGADYGMHLPLHGGAEVAIAHLDGDPDRPIILGSPPNARTVSPVRDENAQQSRIRTRSGITITLDDLP